MTNEELVFAARRGDKTAEEKLLKGFAPLVKSIVAKYFLFGGEKEDLIQEGMVGLYSAINSYERSGANFSTYAYCCIKNAVVDVVKKSNGAKYSALNNYISIVDTNYFGVEFNVEDEIIRRENKMEILQKLSGELSSLESKFLLLQLDGADASEIAEVYGVTPKIVSNALARAKSKLRKLYETEE